MNLVLALSLTTAEKCGEFNNTLLQDIVSPDQSQDVK